ncbi:MAG TPA: alanine racemase [Gudongella oleilytica]|nr:alanine racemase [Gudongella oleilytica]
MERTTNIRPTYVEVNLDNLAHNYTEIRRIVRKETEIMPVIKANGYGHGAIELAKLYTALGVNRLAVSLLNEAIELRRAGIDKPILILNFTPGYQMIDVAANDLTQAIYRYEDAVALSEAALEMDKKLKIHIKLDTGMSRIGFLPSEDAIDNILKISQLPNLEIEGIFTHFAKSDESDKSFTRLQFDRFMRMIEALENKGLFIPLKHISNSSAIIDLPEYNLDIVRPGTILYGYYPSDEVNKERIELRPAMTLRTVVSNIKTLPAGTGISYNHVYSTPAEARIATVPIGYADGYPRTLTGRGQVFVAGKRVTIEPRICMDQMMFDATGLGDVKVGDEVIYFGYGNKDWPSVDEVAKTFGTINYEIICMMGRRLPRVYIKDGRVIKTLDYLLD